jgi:hypothetical protein
MLKIKWQATQHVKLNQQIHKLIGKCVILPLHNLTPWSRGLLEKLTVLQLVKKFPAFYGTQRFITVFTRASHLSLSWASSIQSRPPSHCLNIHFDIILQSAPGSHKWSPSLRSTHQKLVCTSIFPLTCYMPRPPHPSRFDYPNNIYTTPTYGLVTQLPSSWDVHQKSQVFCTSKYCMVSHLKVFSCESWWYYIVPQAVINKMTMYRI